MDKRRKHPLFIPPRTFVIRPDCSSNEPFFKHNHQPAITWCDNGDLLASWFSADEENGRGMVVLASRLRAGSDEWEEASLFFKVPDRNMTGLALFNDGAGNLYHINGVEAAGDWQNLIMVQRTSTDNGQTWSAPKIIAPEHTKRHQVIAGTILTREGWFIKPVMQVRVATMAPQSTLARTMARLGQTLGTEHLYLILRKEMPEVRSPVSMSGSFN